jgi:hypothetical protein
MDSFNHFHVAYIQEHFEKKARKEEEILCRRLLREVSKRIPDIDGQSRLNFIEQVFLPKGHGIHGEESVNEKIS